MLALTKTDSVAGEGIQKLKDTALTHISKMKKMIDVQYNSTELLSFNLVNFLTLAQIENKKLVHKVSHFDVKEALDHIVKLFQDKIQAQSIRLTVNYEGFQDHRYKIHTDKQRL